MSEQPIKIMLVDDHPMVRMGLRSMLTAAGLEVVAEAESGQEALEKIPQAQPDIVLMDIRMPDMDGLTALQAINATPHPPRVIMVTTYKSTTYLLRALAAGAAGYVLKHIPPAELLATVQAVAAGQSQVDQAFLQSVLRDLDETEESQTTTLSLPEPLTPREMDVLRLLVEGLTNQAIATTLVLSPATVKGYLQTIFQKLNVSDRTQAAVTAIRLGLVR